MDKVFKLIAVLLVVSLLLIVVPGCAENEETASFPEKPVTIVCPFGAGGTTDLYGRIVAEYLQDKLGVSVIVENRTGAGGEVGYEYLSGQPADGYTLGVLVLPNGVLNSVAGVYDLDVMEKFDFIYSHAAGDSNVILVSPNSEIGSFEDLIDVASEREITASMTYGLSNSALGYSVLHSTVDGLNITRVPYDSGPDAIAATQGQHTDITFAGVVGIPPMIKEGVVKAIVYFGEERHPDLPEVPTLNEFYPGVAFESVHGIIAPKGIPQDVLDSLANALEEVYNDPGFKEKLEKQFQMGAMGPDEFKEKALEYAEYGEEIMEYLELLLE